jgi:hypothetical protein
MKNTSTTQNVQSFKNVHIIPDDAAELEDYSISDFEDSSSPYRQNTKKLLSYQNMITKHISQTITTAPVKSDIEAQIELQTQKFLKELLVGKNKDNAEKLKKKHFIENLLHINNTPATFEEHKESTIKSLANNGLDPAYISILREVGRICYTEDISKNTPEALTQILKSKKDGESLIDLFKADKTERANCIVAHQTNLRKLLHKALTDDKDFAKDFLAKVFYFTRDVGTINHKWQSSRRKGWEFNFGPKYILPADFDDTTKQIREGSSFNKWYLNNNRASILKGTLAYIKSNTITKDQLDTMKKFLCGLLVVDNKDNLECQKLSLSQVPNDDKSRNKTQLRHDNSNQKTLTNSTKAFKSGSPKDKTGPKANSQAASPYREVSAEYKNYISDILDFYYYKQHKKIPNTNQKISNTDQIVEYDKEADFLRLGKIHCLNETQQKFVTEKGEKKHRKINFMGLGSDTGSGKSSIVSDKLFPVLITEKITEDFSKNKPFEDEGFKNFVDALFEVVKNIKNEAKNNEDRLATLKKVIRLGSEKDTSDDVNDINNKFYETLLNDKFNIATLEDALLKTVTDKDQGDCAINIQPNLFIDYYNNYHIIAVKAIDYRKGGSFIINDLINDVVKKGHEGKLKDKNRISLTIDEAHLLSKKDKFKLKKELKKKLTDIGINITFVSATLRANSAVVFNDKEGLGGKKKNKDRIELLARLEQSLGLGTNTPAKVNVFNKRHSSAKHTIENSSTSSTTVISPTDSTAARSPAESLKTSFVRATSAFSPTVQTNGTVVYNGTLDEGDCYIIINNNLSAQKGLSGEIKSEIRLSENIKSSIEDYRKILGQPKEKELFVFPVTPAKTNEPKKFIILNSEKIPQSKKQENKNKDGLYKKEDDYYFSEDELKKNISNQAFVYFCPTAEDHNPPSAVMGDTKNPYRKVIAILPEAFLNNTTTEINSTLYQIRGRARQKIVDLNVFTKSASSNGEINDRNNEFSRKNKAEKEYRESIEKVLKDTKQDKKNLSTSLNNKSGDENYKKIYNEFTQIQVEKYSRYINKSIRSEEKSKSEQKSSKKPSPQTTVTLAEKFLLANIHFNLKKDDQLKKDNQVSDKTIKDAIIESAEIFGKSDKSKIVDKKLKNLFANSISHSLADPEKGKTEVIDSDYLKYFETLLRIEFVKQIVAEAKSANSTVNNMNLDEIKFGIKAGDLVLSFKNFTRTYSELVKDDLKTQFTEVANKKIFEKATAKEINDHTNNISKYHSSLSKEVRELEVRLETDGFVRLADSKLSEKALPKGENIDFKDCNTEIEGLCNRILNLLVFSKATCELKVTEIRGELEQKDKEIKILKQEIAEKNKEIKQHKDNNSKELRAEIKIADKAKENEALEQKNGALEQEKEELKQKIADKAKENEELKQENGALEQQNEALEREIADKAKENGALKRENREAEICKALVIPVGLTFAQISDFMLDNWGAVYGDALTEERDSLVKAVKGIENYIETGNDDAIIVERMKEEIKFFCGKYIKDQSEDVSTDIFKNISVERALFSKDGVLDSNIKNLIFTYKEKNTPQKAIEGKHSYQLNTNPNQI